MGGAAAGAAQMYAQPMLEQMFIPPDQEGDVLDAWNDLSYIEGALFTVWLFILYYGKVWIDSRFKGKECKCSQR